MEKEYIEEDKSTQSEELFAYSEAERIEKERSAIAAARIILMRDGTLKEKMACAMAVRRVRKMKKRAKNKRRG